MPHFTFADRTKSMGASAIREMLKVASQPGVVSLAGGLPAPETFPMDILPELLDRACQRFGPAALQYDRTEGFGPFCEALTVHLQERKGICVDPDALLISSGSQGTLDALGKILISQGNRVAVESPTYLGAIQAFNPYGPRYVSLETDEEGLVPESLEKALAEGPIQLVYLVATFQNPTGRTLNLQRRQRLAEIAKRHGLLIVEDDPYSELRYRGGSLPPIQVFAPERVVYIGTLSKVFAPGFRIGYCVAPEPVRRQLVLAKQGVDLHTGTLAQAMAAEYLAGGYLQRHLPRIIDSYRPRLDAVLDALAGGLSDAFRWSRPEGGMFVWLEGPPGLDMAAVNRKAVHAGVAAVPGKYFFADPGCGENTMRLNFTHSDVNTLRHAVAVLCSVIESSISGLHSPAMAVN